MAKRRKIFTVWCILPVMLRTSLFVVFFLVAFPVSAQSFSDVTESREDFASIEDLKGRGVFEGRPDGTFGPDDFVNRAEAITIVVRAVANVNNLPTLKNCFPDVYGEEWYVQPVCYAKDLGWVSGYPDGTFQPVRTVAKAEFLKILLNGYGVDLEPIEKFKRPLAADVSDGNTWYFPYLSYALASSMTSADTFGNLNPGNALTRGQVALLVHRFLLYREGQRTQELLRYAEQDVRRVFAALDVIQVGRAFEAASRVKLAAYGALERLPDSAIVQVTDRLAEALLSLVYAYDLVQQGALPGALASTQEAYRFADDTDAINEGSTVYTDRIRAYAHDLAEDIRTYQNAE